jgi:cytoskeleton protein RodZ
VTEEALPVVETDGPGAMLARGREAKRLSVDEVAGRLKFAPRQIEALEADDYARLPGATFVRGMIRGYARLLGTEPAPMLEAYERRHVQPPTVEASGTRTQPRIPFPDGRTRSTRVYTLLIAVMVLVTAAVVYEWQFGLPSVLTTSAPTPAPAPLEPAHVAVTPAASPADAPPASLAAAPAQPAQSGVIAAAATSTSASNGDRLEFRFTDESWVEVKDADGKTLLSQLNAAGSQKVVEGRAPFTLVIGNASAVQLRHNDASVDLKPHMKVDVARMTLK